jgi:hypothetical protein
MLLFNANTYSQDIRYGDDLFLAQDFDDDDNDDFGDDDDATAPTSSENYSYDRAGIRYQVEGGDAVAGKPVLVVKNVFFHPEKRQFYASSRDKLFVEAMDNRAKDLYVGVRRIEIAIDSGEYHEYDGAQSGKFSIETEGPHVVRFRAIDRVGNPELEKSLTINIDNTPPTLNVEYQVPLPGRYCIIGNVVYVPYGQNVKIIPRAYDAASGVRLDRNGKENGIYYAVISKNNSSVEYKPYDKGVGFQLEPGWNIVRFKAIDNVSNESKDYVLNVFVDNWAPIIRIKPKYELVARAGKAYATTTGPATDTTTPAEDDDAGDDDDFGYEGTTPTDIMPLDTEAMIDNKAKEYIPGSDFWSGRPGEEEDDDFDDDDDDDDMGGTTTEGTAPAATGEFRVDEPPQGHPEEGNIDFNKKFYGGANATEGAKIFSPVENTFTVKVYDKESGAREIYIRLDTFQNRGRPSYGTGAASLIDQGWSIYRKPVMFFTHGKHLLEVVAIDCVGNLNYASLEVWVDNIPPESVLNDDKSDQRMLRGPVPQEGSGTTATTGDDDDEGFEVE